MFIKSLLHNLLQTITYADKARVSMDSYVRIDVTVPV